MMQNILINSDMLADVIRMAGEVMCKIEGIREDAKLVESITFMAGELADISKKMIVIADVEGGKGKITMNKGKEIYRMEGQTGRYVFALDLNPEIWKWEGKEPPPLASLGVE